jgi:hypothetical protein
MIPNLYTILTSASASNASRQEFRSAVRTLCHPAIIAAWGVAVGAALAAVVVAAR